MTNCQTCPIEDKCHYKYKPCECVNQRKFTPAPVPYIQHERELLAEIAKREHWEEKATELANDIAQFFDVDIGEHSNCNCPVQNAINLVAIGLGIESLTPPEANTQLNTE